MILEIDKISYDISNPNVDNENSTITFMLTYRNEEFYTLLEKINLIEKAKEIIAKNNGNIIGEYDEFYDEISIMNAVNEFKELFSDEEYEKEIFSEFLKGYRTKDHSLSNLSKYLFMLSSSSINKISSL